MTEEQPIDIHQYTWAIRHALPKILVLALFAAVTAAVQTFFLPAEAYKASTTILARDTLASNQFADATTVTRRLATVNLLTRTTDVLSLAASKLPGTTVDDLRSAVHSSALSGSERDHDQCDGRHGRGRSGESQSGGAGVDRYRTSNRTANSDERTPSSACTDRRASLCGRHGG